jgi:two-component system, chemotaxis family, sensor kinase CheA
MDVDKYKDLFLSESFEHLNGIDSFLVKLERHPEETDLYVEVLRHAHTLKGISAAMGYEYISDLAHSLEGMVENIKNKKSAGGIKVLFGAVDEIRKIIELLGDVPGVGGTAITSLSSDASTGNGSSYKEFSGSDSTSLFKDLNVLHKPSTLKRIRELRVRTGKLDTIMETVSELMINRMQLSSWLKNPKGGLHSLINENDRLVNELQYQILQMRLTPIAQAFTRFPRMVRDLSEKLEKEVDLLIEGGDIEIDGALLEQVGEPLVHLIRNAADHGIDKKGTIKLFARREKDKVLIDISDDGRGINWKKLAERAKSVGVVGVEELEDPRDILFLGLSSAEEVTEISGRGVGMGVVKSAVEKMGGYLRVSSEQGKGTTFTMELPVSIAIIKGFVVEISENNYVAPVSSVHKLYSVKDLTLAFQGTRAFFTAEGVDVPLIDLRQRFCPSDARESISKVAASGKLAGTVIVADKENDLYGFLVDRVVSQQDVVVKPLSDDVRQVVPFSSATILENGIPAPILDFNVLV